MASFLIVLSFLSLVCALPSPRPRASFQLQNGVDAVNLNNQFSSLSPSSPCTSGTNACVDGRFAQCVNGAYVLTSCTPGLVCAALPLVNSPGTSITCTTQSDLEARIAATGATPESSNSSAPTPASTSGPGSTSSNSTGAQSSLTLLSSVIATNFSQDGLSGNSSEPGEVASLTSTNNFINYCATLPDLPITNGQQLQNGSCNPAPMGAIPSTSNMPSSKFVSPVNFAVVPPNTTFRITLAVRNLATGYFVNPDENYLAAPQQLDPTTGLVQGHSHIVIEALTSLNQTTPTDPTKFAFFAALNSKADANGNLYANVTGGLPEGAYKLSSVTTAMNHQLVVLPVAQRGVSDDTIYFTVAGSSQKTPSAPSQSSVAPTPTETPDDPCY